MVAARRASSRPRFKDTPRFYILGSLVSTRGSEVSLTFSSRGLIDFAHRQSTMILILGVDLGRMRRLYSMLTFLLRIGTPPCTASWRPLLVAAAFAGALPLFSRTRARSIYARPQPYKPDFSERLLESVCFRGAPYHPTKDGHGG